MYDRRKDPIERDDFSDRGKIRKGETDFEFGTGSEARDNVLKRYRAGRRDPDELTISGERDNPAEPKSSIPVSNNFEIYDKRDVDAEPEPEIKRDVRPSEPRPVVKRRASSLKRPVLNRDATQISAAVTKKTPPRDETNGRAENKNKKKVKKKRKGDETDAASSVVKCMAYITFVLIAAILISVIVILAANDVYAFVKSDDLVEVEIPEDATLNDVAEVLHENKIIKYPFLFKTFAKVKKDPCEFVAGKYSITAMLSYQELLSEFKTKTPTGVSWITIPEGYTTDEIINMLVEAGIGEKDKYIDVINNYDFDYWFIDELGDSWKETGRFYRLDGYLFPDSYEFYNASSEETVINKMLARFNSVFIDSYKESAAALGYTVDQIVTLASIVEKEAGAQSDFSTVSSVFHNRLNSGGVFKFLESDATIVYALQHSTGVRPKLTSEDLQYDSPYNSRLYEGLPPGPIANPSNSAILAALNPLQTNYYFFVSSGSKTDFSVTRAEHEAKVAAINAGKTDDNAPEG